MKIYNTLARKKEEFTKLGDKFRIYVCGPTVYNYIHIGNARPLVVFDVLRRYLKYRGEQIIFVQNFTDIDDKMIKRANSEGVTVKELAEKFIAEYKKDAAGLNVMDADIHPRATDNIPDIIEFIQTLMEKGFAYESKGDVYFRAERFDGYGKLSHQPLDELEAGARIDISEIKENPMDFALWKAAKPGEPKWPSPWGEGRPGWHIECSVMATKYLGKTIDLHGGGQDLIFPHHENEIAQSECANGCEFSRFWMHNGYINIDNRKMSKSLNNFFTVREIAEKYGYEPIRLLMVSAHYRNPINFSADILEQSVSALERLYGCRSAAAYHAAHAPAEKADGDDAAFETLLKRKAQFDDALDDDLNTADALAAVFELAKDINKLIASGASKVLTEKAGGLFESLCGVLGILYGKKDDEIPAEIRELAEKRQQARKAKDFKEADRIRAQLDQMGYILEDGAQGVRISKK